MFCSPSMEFLNLQITKNGWFISVQVSSFFFLFSFLYYYKIDSTRGRLFIWKVSFNMIINNPIGGIGIDGFKRTYMLFQEHYFAKHPNSIYAFLVHIPEHTRSLSGSL